MPKQKQWFIIMATMVLNLLWILIMAPLNPCQAIFLHFRMVCQGTVVVLMIILPASNMKLNLFAQARFLEYGLQCSMDLENEKRRLDNEFIR